MSDDRERALRKLLETIGGYAELYPNLPQRMAQIAANPDPTVRRYVDDVAAALAQQDTAEKGWIASRFGLSPKESQIALHLAEGGSVADYARKHGVSEQTVRSQLKSIFGKTGVNRQSALAALFNGSLTVR